MAAEPIQLLDGIVRGIVVAGYDFVRLAFVGFVTPFITRTRRFWRGAMCANKRLSALTFLVICVLISLSIGFGTSQTMISGAVGLSRSPDVTLPAAIVISIIVALIVDVILRASLLTISNRVKREMYMSLARIGVANILLGVSAMMLFWGPSWILPPAFSILHSFSVPNWFDNDPAAKILVFYPTPFIFLFSVSLAVVLVKALSIKGRIKRFGIGVSVVLVAPILLIYAIIFAIFIVYRASGDTSSIFGAGPSSPALMQRYTKCRFRPDRIEITSFLKLRSLNSLPIEPRILMVHYDDPTTDESYVGINTKGTAEFVILNANYTRVDLVATYEQKPKSALPTGQVSCTLQFVTDPLKDSDEQVY